MTIAHGVTAREPLSGAIPITTASISTIGLIAWADDADPIAFPANTPVLVTSINRALSSAGYGGTLRRALEAMQPITNPTMVVVRCSSAAKVDVIGGVVEGSRTGIQALLSAKSKLGLTPKIIIAPQLENPDVDQALIAVCKKLRGYCYSTPRDESGVILSDLAAVQAYRDTLGDREIELLWPEFTSGNVLISAPVIGSSSRLLYCLSTDLNPDSSLNPTMTVTVNGTPHISEPWTTALSADEGAANLWVQRALENAGLTVIASTSGDIQYNFTITSPDGYADVVITPPANVFFRDGSADATGSDNPRLANPVTFSLNTTTSTATYGAGNLPTTAVAAALRAQIDNDIGWHKSLSNVVVTGSTGISKDITWDLEDQNTDAAFLNNHQVTTLIQHLGFRFWGNRNCSSDPQFAFEVYTRTAQVMLDTIVNGVFPFVDQPLTGMLVKDIIDSISAVLRRMVKADQLIGAACWYDPDGEGNSPESLSQGQFWIDYDYTPVPPLEQLGLNQRITTRYLVNFAQMIAQAA